MSAPSPPASPNGVSPEPEREPFREAASAAVRTPQNREEPGSAPSRAGAFRRQQEQRRSARNERVGVLLVVVIVVLGVIAIVTARPYFPGSNHPYPNPGPPIIVSLGTPVVGTVPCSGGGTGYTERIPWINSTQPIVTGDINVKVYEIYDGDFIGDPGAVASATPSNVCAGTPPTGTALWYIVLAAPNGSNFLTYTVGKGWLNLSGTAANLPIEEGSFLTLVSGVSLAGTGRGLAVVGASGGSSISGSIPL